MKDDIEKKVQAISLDQKAKDSSINNIKNLTRNNDFNPSHSLDHWQGHSDFIINKSKGKETVMTSMICLCSLSRNQDKV